MFSPGFFVTLSVMQPPELNDTDAPWYAGVTRYQWLVLAIASAGWIFDVFEGQLFNITRQQMSASCSAKATSRT